MKRFVITLFSSFYILLNLYGQEKIPGTNSLTSIYDCNPTFQKRYGGSKADIGYSIVVNPDGTYVIGGYTSSFGNGGYDGFIQKIDKAGNIIWSKAIGGAGDDIFLTVKATPDGGYVAVGTTKSYGGGTSGVAWMVKVDATGNLQWSRKYDDGNPYGSNVWDVTTTSDGGYALTGSNLFTPGLVNAMVIKTDNTGAVVWAKSFDSFNSDESFGIVEDADTLVIQSHQYGQSSSMYDMVLTKINRANGNVIWARNYDIENKSNRAYQIFKTAAGYALNLNDDIAFSVTNPEQVIISTDRNGAPLSLTKISYTPNRYSSGITPTNDGGYLSLDQDYLNPGADLDLVKISKAGTLQWSRKYGGTGQQIGTAVRQTLDGGYLAIGYNNNSATAINDSNDIYLLKTDSLGNSPGCNNLAPTPVTLSAPAYSYNAGFVWASVTNISFGTSAVTPVVVGINPNITQLCASCISTVTDTVINDYAAAISFDKCKNILTVSDASKYKVGDTVLLIQMKGAVIDSSNTATFGTVTDFKNAGNYEFNYIKSKSGNNITLKNVLTKQYDLPGGVVQLIRVPYFQKMDLPNTLTCLPWNGSVGGVLVFNVADTVSLNSNIDVSGKGFRGGNSYSIGATGTSCFQAAYFYDSASTVSSRKGEGIVNVGADKLNGRGHLANGGGGGNGHNSGGGGGSNGAAGGFGGYQLVECNNTNFDNRGIGGILLPYNNTSNKIFMGGGGGAGHKDGVPTIDMSSAGGNGGGIVIIKANHFISNGYSISANGFRGKQCDLDTFTCLHDGMGGGGAGGSVLLDIANFVDNNKENVSGGKGADLTLYNAAAGHVGPGGGASGGVVWLSKATLPANSTVTNSGGINGVILLDANNPSGAAAGQNGQTLFNLAMPVDNTLFVSTFDSAKFDIVVSNCTSFKFRGLGNVVSSQVVKWQWYFGDGGVDSTQTVSHSYLSPGTYTVKLIATDVYGCVATFNVDLTVFCRCEAIKITSPNPARNVISITGLGCGTNAIILYNALGQKVKQVVSDNPAETIDVSNLAKGMYFIKVINARGFISNFKVEKM